jgi:hypothetical protein
MMTDEHGEQVSGKADGKLQASSIDSDFEVEADLDIRMSISIYESDDPLGVLKQFSARFSTYDDADDEQDVGSLFGWIGWRVLGEDVADAADAISSDATYIGDVAAHLLEDDANDSLVEDVVLIDRMWIEPEFRGRGLLGDLVDRLIVGLRLHIDGCVVVTEPEPQQQSGGPYPDGPTRDRAMAGLCGSLRSAGFTPWTDGRAYWRHAER